MADKYVNLNHIIETLENEWGYEGMREDLERLPTADVETVVRCKDCKYLFDYSPDEKPFCELFADGYDHQFRPNPEDYCSRGQLRTPKERGGEK